VRRSFNQAAGKRAAPLAVTAQPTTKTQPNTHLEASRGEAQCVNHVQHLIIGGAVQSDALDASGALCGPRLLVHTVEGGGQVGLSGLALPEAASVVVQGGWLVGGG